MAHTQLTRATLFAASVFATAGVANAQQSGQLAPALVPVTPLILMQISYVDVIANLEGTGYQIVDMRSTFLGRIKLRARNAIHMREIVVSRSTGEILSDVIIAIYGQGIGGQTTTRSTPVEAPGGAPSPGVEGNVTVGGAEVSVGGGGISVEVGGLGVGIGH